MIASAPTNYHDRSFAEILIEEELVPQDQLAEIMGRRENTTEPLGDLLVRLGVITDKDRARCMGKQIGVPFVDLARAELDAGVARLISHRLAGRLRPLPLERD